MRLDQSARAIRRHEREQIARMAEQRADSARAKKDHPRVGGMDWDLVASWLSAFASAVRARNYTERRGHRCGQKMADGERCSLYPHGHNVPHGRSVP